VELSELEGAESLLDDPRALAQRYERDGCLLLRGLLDPSVLADITEQATEALVRCGVAQREDGTRWTGAPMPHEDDTDVNDLPALTELVDQIDQGTDPLRAVARRVLGQPVNVWRSLHVFASVPDDPAYVTAPHQDNFAASPTGDYRRFWIALTDIPFGDGGLGLAAGSHHKGRLPRVPLPGFANRAPAGATPTPATGIDPWMVEDHWHTADMSPGDILVFRPDLVHRGIPGGSDRIRMALAVIVSGARDPRPDVLYTGAENRARRNRIRALAAPFGLSEMDMLGVAAAINRAGVEISEETVRAAVRGEYARA
jgi:1-deoxypentalenic acid 11beta-hydroxylase